MKKLLFLLLLALLMLPAGAFAQDDLPPLDDLDDGWNIIETGGDTICARGTPYQFYVRPGNPENLMIYFQGGGACWNPLTCREGGTFDDTVGDEEVQNYNGIFDFENEENPIADYSVVFIPYCTADIHSGDSLQSYARMEINHRGYANSAVVLDWAYENYGEPANVFVTGSSAGAYGAIYHSPYIIEQYGADANIAVLGDAGMGVTEPGWGTLGDWDIYANLPDFVPGMEELTTENFTFPGLYSTYAAAYPDVPYAQFTNALDEVQITFYTFGGTGLTPEMWVEGMVAAADLTDELDNSSTYIAPGGAHTILASPDLYDMEVVGVRFLDWLTELINGEQPEAVRCVECGEPGE